VAAHRRVVQAGARVHKVGGQRVGALPQQVGGHGGVAVLAGQHEGGEALVAALVEHRGEQALPLGGRHAALAPRARLGRARALLQGLDDGAADRDVAVGCKRGQHRTCLHSHEERSRGAHVLCADDGACLTRGPVQRAGGSMEASEGCKLWLVSEHLHRQYSAASRQLIDQWQPARLLRVTQSAADGMSSWVREPAGGAPAGLNNTFLFSGVRGPAVRASGPREWPLKARG
jgi:hypothetical protein